jgi:hypothetical protein
MQAAQRSADPAPARRMHARQNNASCKKGTILHARTRARGWILVPIPMQCNALQASPSRSRTCVPLDGRAEPEPEVAVVSRRKRKRWPAGGPEMRPKNAALGGSLCSVHERARPKCPILLC